MSEVGGPRGPVTGEGSTIVGAFEDAAMKAVYKLEKDGMSRDEIARFLEGNFHESSVQIEIQPHNQWIKTYKVTLPGI